MPLLRCKIASLVALLLAAASAPAAVRAQSASRIVLDSATIAESGARTLAELLAARVPGLSVTNLTGAPGIAAQVSSRAAVGFSGSGRPALILDGVLTRDDFLYVGSSPDGQALADHWNLPVEEIAGVEVLLGASAGMATEQGASRGAVLVTTHRPQASAWNARAFADVRSVGAGAAIRTNSTRTGTLSGGGSTYYCTLQAEVAGDCTPTGTWTREPFPDGSPFASTERVRGGLSASGALPLGLAARVAAIRESDPGALGAPVARTDFAAAFSLPRRGRWQSDLDLRVQHVAGDFLGYSALRRDATYGPFDADSSLDERSTFSDLQAQAPAWTSRRTSLGSRTAFALSTQTSIGLRAGVEALDRGYETDVRGEHGFFGPGRSRDVWESERDAWTVALDAQDRRAIGRFELQTTIALLRSESRQSDSLGWTFTPDAGTPLYSIERSSYRLEGHTQRVALRVVDRSGLSIGAGLRREGRLGDPSLAVLPHVDVRWGWSPSATPLLSRFDLWTAYGESIDLQSLGDAFARNLGALPGVRPGDIERTREWELGADLQMFGDAAIVSVRTFRRNVENAIIYQPSFTFPDPYRLVMGAAIEGSGAELALQLQRRLGARAQLTSRLWLASARSVYGGAFAPSFLSPVTDLLRVSMEVAPGRAVGEIVALRREYADTNGNGVVESAELGDWRIADRGSLVPTRTMGAMFRLGLGRVSIGTTLEGKFGHVRPQTDGGLCSARSCDGLYDPATTLDAQAAALSRYATLIDASFVRMRELWIRWRLADGRFGTASMSLVGQNLLTLAASGGEDPETGRPYAAGIAAGFYQQPIAPSLGLRIDIVAGGDR